MIFKPLFIINPFQHLQATLYEVVSNINYPLGPPAFVLCLCFSPNPLRNVFQQWSCILNSLNIRSRYSILLYISPSFCCSFNGLLSLKQCDFCWANFLVIMLYLPFFADVTDIGIGPVDISPADLRVLLCSIGCWWHV